MRTIRIACLALLTVLALPTTASAATGDTPVVCTVLSTADVFQADLSAEHLDLASVVYGSEQFTASLDAGAVFVTANEAASMAPEQCWLVYEVYDEDGNFIGYLFVPVECPEE